MPRLISKLEIIKSLDLSESELSILKVLEGSQMARRVSSVARLAGTPRTTTLHTLKKLTKWKLLKAIHHETHDRWLYNRYLG